MLRLDIHYLNETFWQTALPNSLRSSPSYGVISNKN